jgi:ParB/RepB/Spo0J family partition protein
MSATATKKKNKKKGNKAEGALVNKPLAMVTNGGPSLTDFAPDPDAIREIPIVDIKSNSQNPRESAKDLTQMGYGIFFKLEGSDKPAVVPLALSEKPEDKAEYCKLMEKFENGIVESAASIKKSGQLQGASVRKLPDGGYDLIFGCRRLLSCLYNHCKHGDNAIIRAVVSDNITDEEARDRSLAENIQRLNMNPMEQARIMARLKQAGKSIQEIQDISGIDHQVVRQRLVLLKLEPALQQKVEDGELGVVKALNIVKGKTNPNKGGGATGKGHTGDGSRRKVPTLKEFQAMYENDGDLHEEVRKFLAAKVLHLEYMTFAKLQAEKKKIADAENKGREPAKDDAA